MNAGGRDSPKIRKKIEICRFYNEEVPQSEEMAGPLKGMAAGCTCRVPGK